MVAAALDDLLHRCRSHNQQPDITGVLLYSKRSMERRRQLRNYRTDQRLRLQGGWNQLKDKRQQTYTHLTDEDLTYVEGKGHELVSRLQAKLGKRKRQIVKLLNGQ